MRRGTSQHDAPVPGLDHAGIAHPRSHEGGEPGLGHGDPPTIDHGGIGTGGNVEKCSPRHEAIIANPRSGRHQRAGIDLGAFGEDDTGAIFDNNPTVGRDPSSDL